MWFSYPQEKDENRIVYDDEAVAQLLDRTQEGQEQKESEMNDYFKSFKVRRLLSLSPVWHDDKNSGITNWLTWQLCKM